MGTFINAIRKSALITFAKFHSSHPCFVSRAVGFLKSNMLNVDGNFSVGEINYNEICQIMRLRPVLMSS